LETAVTESIHNTDVPFYKRINYHLHTSNFKTLFDAYARADDGPVVICMANNHILDFGRSAFEAETLSMSRPQGTTISGIGGDFSEASQPSIIGEMVSVYSVATECSGTPKDWAATDRRSGLVLLPSISSRSSVNKAMEILQTVFPEEKQGLRVLSIHWGPNWAYRHGDDDGAMYRRALAHRIIDELGVDIIYGHSSHHARGIEKYHSKLILYGAGDLINDYEGFENPGDEAYVKFGALYIVDVDPSTGELQKLTLVPTFMDRLRLRRLLPHSAVWQPRSRELVNDPTAVYTFRDFINRLSVADSGGSETAVQLRVVEENREIPGGPTLVFP
jgi:poly-gamma-glutamate synthesis protein (capsule biosynthesis protein)